MSDYQTWKNNTLGQGWDIDHSGDWDCVDMPKSRAVDLYGDWVNTIGYGNAKDIYNNASEHYFEKIPNDPNNPNQLPQQGDIIVFSPTPFPGYTNQYNNPYGHTGVVESADQNGYTLISQSSGTGKPASLNYNTWRYRHCIGWLRPKDLTPPPPPPDPFILTDIAPKQVTINRETKRWNMQYSDLATMKGNPVEDLHVGQGPYTVTVLCHQNTTNYDYYLENRNNLGGFNIYDCSDYVPAIVVPSEPELPIEPVPAPYVLPQAPAAFPSDSTPYTVVKTIMGFSNATDAGNHANAKGTIAEGTYYIFRRYPGRDDLINVTKDLGKPGNIDNNRGGWINAADNVPDVIPEPPAPPVEPTPEEKLAEIKKTWEPPVDTPVPVTVTPVNFRASYKPIDKLIPGKAHKFMVLKTVTIHELGTQAKDITLMKGQTIGIYGTFELDGNVYGRPILKSDTLKALWYGVPLVIDGKTQFYVEPIEDTITELEEEIPSYATTPAERMALHQPTVSDFLVMGVANLEKYLEAVQRFLSGKRKNKR